MIKNLCENFDIYFTCDPTKFETYFWTTWILIFISQMGFFTNNQFEMEGDNQCELGQCIKCILNTYDHMYSSSTFQFKQWKSNPLTWLNYQVNRMSNIMNHIHGKGCQTSLICLVILFSHLETHSPHLVQNTKASWIILPLLTPHLLLMHS